MVLSFPCHHCCVFSEVECPRKSKSSLISLIGGCALIFSFFFFLMVMEFVLGGIVVVLFLKYSNFTRICLDVNLSLLVYLRTYVALHCDHLK